LHAYPGCTIVLHRGPKVQGVQPVVTGAACTGKQRSQANPHRRRGATRLLVEDLPRHHGDHARLLARALQLLRRLDRQVQLRACRARRGAARSAAIAATALSIIAELTPTTAGRLTYCLQCYGPIWCVICNLLLAEVPSQRSLKEASRSRSDVCKHEGQPPPADGGLSHRCALRRFVTRTEGSASPGLVCRCMSLTATTRSMPATAM